MRYKIWHSSLNPPFYAVNGWGHWLERRGFKGNLQEMEQAYIKSKGYETWSEYLMHLGYYGHFNDQCRDFWKNVSRDFAEPPTVRQRMIRNLVTTSFGARFIQRCLGLKGRIAAQFTRYIFLECLRISRRLSSPCQGRSVALRSSGRRSETKQSPLTRSSS